MQQLDDLLADPVQVGAQLHQHLRGDAVALTDEAEQDVFGADVARTTTRRARSVNRWSIAAASRYRTEPGRPSRAPAGRNLPGQASDDPSTVRARGHI
jgi:hypothetical protein